MSAPRVPSLTLGQGGTLTTKLGFGCSGISGGLSKRRSLELLETAYDAGIRHFDVAPMYGFGTAEEVVGEFASRHAGSISLTTKYGIPPPAGGAVLNTVRALVRPIANRVSFLRRSLIQQAGKMARPPAKVTLTAESMLQSLEASLVKLRVERVDLFLLHEAEASDLEDDRLLRALEDAKRSGKLLNFGVSHASGVVQQLIAMHPDYCPVVQHEWSVLEDAPLDSNHMHVCHRTIAGALGKVHAWLQNHPEESAAYAGTTGLDLGDKEITARLLLTASFVRTPGMVLFSSRQPQRIRQNVAACIDPPFQERAMQLFHNVRVSLSEMQAGGTFD